MSGAADRRQPGLAGKEGHRGGRKNKSHGSPGRGFNTLWQVVYIAPTRLVAESLQGVLTGEGFLVSIRPTGPENGGHVSFEVLVPPSEAEEALLAIGHLLLTRSKAAAHIED